MAASELQKAIDKLVAKEPRWREFDPKPSVGARPGKKSTGRPASAAGTGAPFFDEADYTAREYWPDVVSTSSDGVFTVEEGPIKSILLKGGDRAKFAQPPEE